MKKGLGFGLGVLWALSLMAGGCGRGVAPPLDGFDAGDSADGDGGTGDDGDGTDGGTGDDGADLDGDDGGDGVDATDGGDDDPIPFQTGLEVTTTTGRIVGTGAWGLRVFKGIPFAQPPVGQRRFAAPAPVEPWDGLLEADAFGPSCMQAVSVNPAGTSEDCLTLNVWAHTDDEPRPIMVWIYGGGFVIGETAMATYDGADLAAAADVVIVSINYRLGVLGNLAIPELRDEDPLGAVGNMGLLDQIQALGWIHANAPAFGGDPDNITVFGESAGAISACALLGAPLADDLFHKAILQSGNCAMFSSPEPGEGVYPGAPTVYEFGQQAVADLGCADAADRLECLRAVPTAAFGGVLDLFDYLDVLDPHTALGWTIDGVILPEMPCERIRAGRAPARPVLAGSNGNEGQLFTANQVVVNRIDFRQKIAPLVGGAGIAQQVVDLYPVLTYPNAWDAFNAFMGEWLFNCNTFHTVRALDGAGYYYELGLGPNALMTLRGPLHGADLYYVFGTFLDGGIIPTVFDLDLRSRVQTAWGSFARTGVPTWEGGWPPAREIDPEHLRIDAVSGPQDDFRSGRCDALQALGALP